MIIFRSPRGKKMSFGDVYNGNRESPKRIFGPRSRTVVETIFSF